MDSPTLGSNPVLGIGLSLIAAVLLAIGTQLQHRGVAQVRQAEANGPAALSWRQIRGLVGRPAWLSGTLLLGFAVVMQLVSLTVAQLIVVQPLGAVALVITAIMHSHTSKMPLDRRSVRAISLCILGVGTFVTVAAFVAKENPVTGTQLRAVLIILAVTLSTFGVLLRAFRRNPVPPIVYVIAAGILFGFVVTLAKVVITRAQTIIFVEHGPDSSDVLTVLCVVGLIAAGLLGSYFVQTAHSSNPPDLVVAGLTVIDPLVAVTIGVIVLGEAANAPLWASITFVVSGTASIWGVLSLAHHHPQAQIKAVPGTIPVSPSPP